MGANGPVRFSTDCSARSKQLAEQPPTVVASRRPQGRPLLDFLVAAMPMRNPEELEKLRRLVGR
jgi:hypothetical protein